MRKFEDVLSMAREFVVMLDMFGHSDRPEGFDVTSVYNQMCYIHALCP